MTTPAPRFAGVVPPAVTPLTEEGEVDVRLPGTAGRTAARRRRRRHLRPRQLRRDGLPHRPAAGPGSGDHREDRRRRRAGPRRLHRADHPPGRGPGRGVHPAGRRTAWSRPPRSTPSSARTRSSGTSAPLAAAVELPLLAYDIPVCVHSKLSVDLLTRLAVDGVLAGVKDSSGDDVAFRQLALAIAEHAPDARLQPADRPRGGGRRDDARGRLRLGARTGQRGPGRLRAAAPRLRDRRLGPPPAREQDRLTRLFRIVDAADPATSAGATRGVGAFKTALALLGVIDSNAVSLPLRPLDADEAGRVRTQLELAGLL